MVFVQEGRDGNKIELQRWSVPPDKFDSSNDMIQMLEQRLGVNFARVDMSEIRSFEEFEARSRQIGWEISTSDEKSWMQPKKGTPS